jgi:hypothetical protein
MKRKTWKGTTNGDDVSDKGGIVQRSKPATNAAPLPQYYDAKSQGMEWHLFCKTCGLSWALPYEDKIRSPSTADRSFSSRSSDDRSPQSPERWRASSASGSIPWPFRNASAPGVATIRPNINGAFICFLSYA